MPAMPPTTSVTKHLRLITPLCTHTRTRTFSTTPHHLAEGDTGSLRSGGSARSDAFTRREKAAEDLWVYEREKNVIAMMRDKIARQEALLEEDRKVLSRMEDQYGHSQEGREQVR